MSRGRPDLPPGIEQDPEPIPLIGYLDRLSARPGETLEVKVHSEAAAAYHVRLVRIVSADPNPDGPGIVEHAVPSAVDGGHPSRRQPSPRAGSHAAVAVPEPVAVPEGLTLSATIWPTLPGGEAQAVLSAGTRDGGALSLGLDAEGRATAWRRDTAGGTLAATAGPSLPERRWCRIWASIDADGRLCAGTSPLRPGAPPSEAAAGPAPPIAAVAGTVLIAAEAGPDGPARHFNGKIEDPAIHAGPSGADSFGPDGRPSPEGLLAAWDFSIGIPTLAVTDIGPRGLNGRLVNMPMRGMTGSTWAAQEMCWRHAPDHYRAIHFHDDDIGDLGWETDFALPIPEDLPSGVYALRLTCGTAEDNIPFFVAPPPGRPSARLAVVMPTFTYLMYGNNARYDYGPGLEARMTAWGAYPHNPARHREFGLCSYNWHSDGSGIALVTSRRPLLTLRSGYLTLLRPGCGSGLRHFQADTHLLAWLEHRGTAFDIVTDHELHADGAAVLAPYRAVLTGTHPEYHTAESLGAFEGYVAGGGRLAYLGGNGFYWRIGMHAEAPDTLEIRRGEGGIRYWESQPGEYYHATDGAYGGLWRRSGKPPQGLVAVGMSAQGVFEGAPYRRTAASHAPELAWMFEGVGGEVFGDSGLSGGGAAGYELDRTDPALGTPESAVVVARSEGHGPSYTAVYEELLSPTLTATGPPPDELVRADMTWMETPAGGAVFATGSITFCGSLPENGFENDVSRLLGNVIDRFLAG